MVGMEEPHRVLRSQVDSTLEDFSNNQVPQMEVHEAIPTLELVQESDSDTDDVQQPGHNEDDVRLTHTVNSIDCSEAMRILPKEES